MKSNKLWKFPVPSTRIAGGGVTLVYSGGKIWLIFDYYDENKNDAVFNSGIEFISVQAYRHSSEKFLEDLMHGTYDTLVEITESEWLAELRTVNNETEDFWKNRHYAIFLDSHGQYEFIARDYKLLETKEGGINWNEINRPGNQFLEKRLSRNGQTSDRTSTVRAMEGNG